MSAEVDVSFMDWVASCDVGIRVAFQLTLPTAPSPVTTHCREKDVSIQHCDGQPKGGNAVWEPARPPQGGMGRTRSAYLEGLHAGLGHFL